MANPEVRRPGFEFHLKYLELCGRRPVLSLCGLIHEMEMTILCGNVDNKQLLFIVLCPVSGIYQMFYMIHLRSASGHTE